MLGGGWENLTINSGFPATYHLALVAAIQVEWMETNRKQQFEMEIALDDPRKTLLRTIGQFEAGRPVGIPEGQSQRLQLALQASVQFPQPGQYVLIARSGDVERQVGFRVQEGPVLKMKRGLQGPQDGEKQAS
jgi:hypothetical protein